MASTLAISILLLLTFQINAEPDTKTMIVEICQQNYEPEFCLATFHQNIPNHPITVIEFNELAMDQVIRNVTNALTYILKTSPGEKVPYWKQRLDICQDTYNMVEADLKRALDMFHRHDYVTMLMKGQDALLEQVRCSGIMDTQTPVKVNPLPKMSLDVQILIQMALLAQGYLPS